MDKKYLPSKEFVARTITLVALVLIAFGIYKGVIFLKQKNVGEKKVGVVIKPDVIQKDTNKNGIPDWEESLWGLDPTKDGQANKEFIFAKRETLAKENGGDFDTSKPLTENETLSREFFSVIMSLQESGNLDDGAMKAIADTIGKKIIAEPIPDVYARKSIKTVAESKATVTEYYKNLRELILKYENSDIGEELTFVSVALNQNDPGALKQVERVASSYRAFGKELIAITVPDSLANTHLSLANNYEKNAESIEGFTQILSDPLLGMKAIINYKKYNDLLATDIEKLSDIFNDKWYNKSS